MSEHLDAIATSLAHLEDGPIADPVRDGLRRAQRAMLDSRWNEKLDALRARAPFRGLSERDQKRALLRVSQLDRAQRRRAPAGGAVPLDLPMGSCQPGWKQVAALGGNGFAFGSDDTPYVVPAGANASQFDMTGNTVVVATFPGTGAIGVGAACGGWCDLDYLPGSTATPSPLLAGNRAAGSLTAILATAPLGQVAPNALTVSCGVRLQNPFIGLCSGEPNEASLIWACGQATLSIVAVDHRGGRGGASAHADHTETLFLEAGESRYDRNVTNMFGDPWLTNVYGQSDLTRPIGLSVTIPRPPQDARHLYVNVAVEVSAWVESSRDSLVAVDSTGADTGLPIMSAPDYLYPYPTTAAGTGPALVGGVRACGI